MIFKLTLVILSTALICGCSGSSSTPLTSQNVVGTYKGNYGGASETFVFRPDGTFMQTLYVANNPQYTNDGTWRIEGNQTHIELLNVYMALDLHGKFHPEKMYNMEGLWVSLDKRQRIVFKIDYGYAIDKVLSGK